MLTTVLALAIIDRVGRKKLVYWGVSGMALSLLLIGTCFLDRERFRFGGVPALRRHLRLRRGMGAFVGDVSDSCARRGDVDRGVLALTGTYLVGQLTPWMLANLTPAGTFFLFAAMCVPYMLLIWKAVPEMSGRTLEEIERYWTR